MKRIIVVFIAGLLMGAISASVPKTFTGSVNLTNQIAIDLWGNIETWACSQFDTAYGKSTGTCATLMDPCIDGTVFSMTCNTGTGKAEFSVSFNPPGTFDVTVP